MNFNEFAQNIVDNIRDYLPPEYFSAEISLKEVVKNNDTVLTGLMIRSEERNIAPNIYLNQFFEEFKDGRNIESIMKDIAAIRVRNEVSQDFDISNLTDINVVREKIICKVVNYEHNKDYLSEKPYTVIEDLAIMYAIDLGGGNGGRMTAPITNQLLNEYGISKEELHGIAMENLEKETPVFKSMREVLVDMMFPEGIDEDDPRAYMLPPEEDIPTMYVLTNEEKMNGASALLNRKFMDSISEKLGGDFVILPSSIHEVICLRADTDLDIDTLNTMIMDVNETQVSPEERLSDHAYQYDSVEHEIVHMDKMESRLQQRAKDERQDEKPSVLDKLSRNQEEIDKNKPVKEHSEPEKDKEKMII